MEEQLPAVFSCIRSALRRRGSAEETDDYIQDACVRLVSCEREQVVLEPEAFLMRTASICRSTTSGRGWCTLSRWSWRTSSSLGLSVSLLSYIARHARSQLDKGNYA
ncbi:hypothetical protein OOZ63_17380 [Paucibacter sp. PLA-PC-4]|uniref:hypothetical protein n=1 Tax=Paucibacter sp. PLA-PC-4 TaxID=2993655 RepID=UPI00224A7EED|nr:hypothetical protein [Paucibacter sp. PLA-PC-4]MCX2863606.1 hypothetical protein [Paucibacter sp. PLA-PC-4]